MRQNDASPSQGNSGTFRFLSGRDESTSERRLLRELQSAWLLAGALGKREEFWDHVDAVAAAGDQVRAAYDLSLRYCQGKRRRVITRLLLRGAENPDLRRRSTLERRLELVKLRACFASHDEGRKGHYAIGRPFIIPMLRASYLVASQGAGICLGWQRDGAPCETSAAKGSVYCRRHDHDPNHSVWESERDTGIRRLFEQATPAVLYPDPRQEASAMRSAEEIRAIFGSRSA